MKKGTRRTTQLVSSRATNQECAAIILARAQRYGGPNSLMVRWAVMVRDGYEKNAATLETLRMNAANSKAAIPPPRDPA
jgi:hypothetical protein